MLGLVPQALFLLLAPVRLATLRRRRDRIAKNSHLGFLKMVASSCYVISSVILLVIWSETETFKTRLSVASASLEFLASLTLVVLSRQEHTRAVRPSHLLQFFLLVLLLCDAVRLRTLFLMDYPTTLVAPASIHTSFTGLLLLLESLDKRDLFSSDSDRTLPPEETIGLFGRRLLWYLNDLFREGYRKILKPSDLYMIDADLASEERDVRFQNVWADQDKAKKAPLARTIWTVLWLDLLSPVLPRLLQISTTLSQPYLITAMLSFIQNREDTTTENTGSGLIAAFALNYSLLAVSSSWCTQSVARFSTKLRSCLISAIYEKTLHIASKDVDVGSSTVLMNVDVERLMSSVKNLHEFWATVVTLGVALYILYTHLGGAFVAPFLTTLLATGICTWIGKYMRPRYQAWAAATERRVTAIAYAASCMKGIRMLGLSETVLQMLTRLRELEVDTHQSTRKLFVWIMLISNVMFQITTVSTYVTFTIIMLLKPNGSSLDYNVLYGSLSALKLVTSPLLLVLQLIPTLQAGLASLDRIQKFLENESLNADQEGTLDRNVGDESIELLPLRETGISSDRRPSESLFSMKEATFAIGEKPLIYDCDLDVRPGAFVLIVGKVGAGKSVLLRSIIGETTLTSGSFRPSSSGVSFCDQSVWLRNVSIRENIIGEDLPDEAWYRSVLWSCGLLRDLVEMKHGDKTLIGSKGISLSGGQKNRISLARALYARKPMLIMDDMLSGLDNTTEKLVFDRVFGPQGLLRKSGATVLLASHATHFARHADRIVVVSDGHIAHQGTYQELITRKVDLKQHSDDGGEDIETQQDVEPEVLHKSVQSDVAPLEEDTEDDAARQSGDSKSLLFFLKALGPFHTSLYFGLLVLTIVANTVQYLWLKWWADADSSSRSTTIRYLYLFVIITAVDIFMFFLWEVHFAMWFLPRSSLALHASQLKSLMRAKFSYLVSTDIGKITNRFSQDILLVDNELQYAFVNVTYELLTIIASMAMVVIATPPIAATLPVLGAVGYLIQRVYLRTSRQVRLMDLEAKAPLCTHFLESLAGIVTIRAFGWINAYREKNKKYLDQSQVPFYLLMAIQNWLNLVLELAVAGLVTVLVGLAVGLRTKVDPGYLGLALVAAMDLGFNFRITIISWTTLETALSAVNRIRQFTETPSEAQDALKSDPPESWPTTGSVQFKNLAASYSEEGKSVLSSISLEVKPGEKIGLCGRTGSGKSSLVATLFGLLHQQDGEILIDNLPTTAISLSLLRSKIIALPQEPFFLQGTVRYNLAPWVPEAKMPQVTDAQMKDVLEQVQLWDKLGAAAGEGQSALDTSLDNVDSLLSQGERQLFCLARAILMDGKIVVLDEATSSVDAHTDALMQRILRSAFAGRTIIAIAHRLDTILDFDRVVVMDAGKIAEIGDPSTLMQTEGSLFRGLVESQGKK